MDLLMGSLHIQIGLCTLQLPAWCPLKSNGHSYHCQIRSQTLHKLQSSEGLSRGKQASVHPTQYPCNTGWVWVPSLEAGDIVAEAWRLG